MAFVVTQRCCNDASCLSECPVDCIRPRPEDPDFATAEMLYIDPQTCIDCGACADACPVDAIFSEDELPEGLQRYTDINAGYFERHPLDAKMIQPAPPGRVAKELGTLRVAIVGAGPAAAYAAEELMRRADAEVEVIDRLPSPHGLVRAGVAPDHAGTKAITTTFEAAARHAGFRYLLNVEVGEHISHAELMDHHHAVIYAVGASADRSLGIPGESLPGSHSAGEFVAWYNGHPDYADRVFDLSGERAVIVGNGNVALDIARVLTLDPEELARTDIADHALAALRDSTIREVVLLGRRGPVQAAYTSPEFLALQRLPGVDVIIDESELKLDSASQAVLDDPGTEPSTLLKVELAREYSQQAQHPGHKRIVFRYLTSPVEILGTDRVDGLTIVRNELAESGGELTPRPTDCTETIATSLVLRSVGYRGQPVPDLPFDESRHIVPNERGRVVTAEGDPVTGVYVTGWIKRGPRGVIGTNKACAQETVAGLLDDFAAGMLPAPRHDRRALHALLAERRPELVDGTGWRAIDAAERELGKQQGRPRVKFVSVAEMLAASRRH
ncbi:FAD-dependent oxidoreductase [Nocardia nova]|uniref:ferredoxin--NADP(+) reductase n=1 Tax=Nocardia nova TaxID=37330 RepID=A0A2S6A6I2_9NOCA|nr:FAD-dependent oxidoreductase [Nocardia nova]MBV7706930.1 FAD-dependent oxidoreductase [Nocardia nova]PPI94046.1 ferredoxin [Nocardia nova]PPJ28120.1 ferredoxin [Nocardia nova]